MADYSELMKLEKKAVVPKVPTEPAAQKDVVNRSTHQLVNKSADQHINKSTSQHADLSINQQINTSASQQTSKTLKRFGSYLTIESLKELKRIAFESDKKDYEVLQEAVDAYLKTKRTHV